MLYLKIQIYNSNIFRHKIFLNLIEFQINFLIQNHFSSILI